MWHRVNLALLCAAIGAGGCDLLTGPNDAADPFDAEADSAPSTNDASIEPLDGALGELLDADINTGAPKRPEAPPIDAGADAAAVIDAAAIADAEAIIDAEPPVDPFAGECEVGTRRCVDLVTTQTCARDPNGRPRWDAVFGCGFDQVCALDEIEGTALCVSRADLCDEGDLRCASDGRQALRCERRPPFHRTRWTPALDCEAEGMGHCVPFGENEPPAWATSPDALCQNACGTRAESLEGAPCSRHPRIGCAVWICEDGALVPDHTGCLGPGAPCGDNTECSSCRCERGACRGVSTEACTDYCD